WVLAKSSDSVKVERWDNGDLRSNGRYATVSIQVSRQIQQLAEQARAETRCKIDETLRHIKLSVGHFGDHGVTVTEWLANFLRLVEGNNSNSHDGGFILRLSEIGRASCRERELGSLVAVT